MTTIQWQDSTGQEHNALWQAESGAPAPRRMVAADDTLSADKAYRLACEGTGLLWEGDFHNARQLLQALGRRADASGDRATTGAKARSRARSATPVVPVEPAQAFHLYRQAQSQRARTLSQVLIPVGADYTIPLRRAPDLRAAFTEAWGAPSGDARVVSLREVLGLVGAHEWRKKGVPIAALGPEARIHPYYGVFSPVRGEYIDLVATTPLPAGAKTLAFDIGTGTGILAVVLARRGVARVVATDQDPRALACAADNLQRMGLNRTVELQSVDLFPPGRAPLVVCNPPWVPARPGSPIERAVYDEDSRMLRGFLAGLADHLAPGGEGWLILSDLAEHLGLRPRTQLLEWIAAGGLRVVERHDVRPRHGKAADETDPLHAARAAELTSLWRLAAM